MDKGGDSITFLGPGSLSSIWPSPQLSLRCYRLEIIEGEHQRLIPRLVELVQSFSQVVLQRFLLVCIQDCHSLHEGTKGSPQGIHVRFYGAKPIDNTV